MTHCIGNPFHLIVPLPAPPVLNRITQTISVIQEVIVNRSMVRIALEILFTQLNPPVL